MATVSLEQRIASYTNTFRRVGPGSISKPHEAAKFLRSEKGLGTHAEDFLSKLHKVTSDYRLKYYPNRDLIVIASTVGALNTLFEESLSLIHI